MLFRSGFDKHDSSKYDTVIVGESLTHQSMSADCDINNIMKRYEKTGVLEHVNHHQGDYGDFLDAEDYLSSMLKVHEAQDMFSSLPATIRAKFENDPAQFLAFVHDDANRPEMAAMGLLDETPGTSITSSEKPATAISEASGEAARSETE